MFTTGKPAAAIIEEQSLTQIVDEDYLQQIIDQVLHENSRELASYLDGKENLSHWFFGQVMARTKGQASPALVRERLTKTLQSMRSKSSD
jgi:aspartyl-tRNA(Asn)/glutamyl-tRNA(Gln) amidotransferase subunit B